MKRKKELVHGLTETVALADWDFAILLASLKLYAKVRHAQNPEKYRNVIAYSKQLRKKLRKPFNKLIKRTKKEHRKLLMQLEHDKTLEDF